MMKTMMAFLLCIALLIPVPPALADETAAPAVYYNPNGGSRFHANRECDSISQTYWPYMQSASPAQLRSLLVTMLPCSFCVTNEVLNTWYGGTVFWSAWYITRDYLYAQEQQPHAPLSWMTSPDMDEMLICVLFRDNRIAQCHLQEANETWHVVEVCWVPSIG